MPQQRGDASAPARSIADGRTRAHRRCAAVGTAFNKTRSPWPCGPNAMTAITPDRPQFLVKNNLLVTETPDFATRPAYFRERQSAAWERFEKLPMPVRTDENWRFA